MFLSIMIFDALLACQARPLLDISKFDKSFFCPWIVLEWFFYDFIPSKLISPGCLNEADTLV